MDNTQQIFEKILIDSGLAKHFMTRQPAYRFWRVGEDRYFWTTEAVVHNGKKRFVSGIYKHRKKDNALKLTHERYHTKRKDAKDRAHELYYDKAKA